MQTEPVRLSLRERQRRERADLILQAAEEVLTEKGYHDTSIDEIASRVGIAKGTVYLHFPSKEDLVFALFERELDTFLHTVDHTVAQEGMSPRAKLEIILRSMYQGLLGKRIQLLLELYTSMDIRKDLLERKMHVHDRMERVSTQISALLEEGKAVGEFDSTIPTPVMLTAFFSLLSLRGYKRLVVDGQMSPEELVTYLERIYFKGIAAH
jgi:AcrR family transcriptional regulator